MSENIISEIPVNVKPRLKMIIKVSNELAGLKKITQLKMRNNKPVISGMCQNRMAFDGLIEIVFITMHLQFLNQLFLVSYCFLNTVIPSLMVSST